MAVVACYMCGHPVDEDAEQCPECLAHRPGRSAEASHTTRARAHAQRGSESVVLTGVDIPFFTLVGFLFKILLAVNIAAIPFILVSYLLWIWILS